MTVETLCEAIDRPKLRAVSDWLRNYEERPASLSHSECQRLLAQLKREAVYANDQLTAKAIWCLETIGRIQNHFESSICCIGAGEFRSAWDDLDRCLTEASFLDRHFNEVEGEFGIEHVWTHAKQFQELYPFKWGISPGYLRTDIRCSICNKRRTLRNRCQHKIGEIYNGEMCGKKIQGLKLLHISLVEYPAQKVSVIFPNGNDDYRFELVKYVVKGLNHPWARWSYMREERRTRHLLFANADGKSPCPCGSSLIYEDCCLNKETVMPHFHIAFEESPRMELPRLVVQSGWEQKGREPLS